MLHDITVITTSYPCHESDPSGHFVRAHVRRLTRAGHTVHLLAPRPSQGELVSDPGVHVVPIAHFGAFGWPGAVHRLRSGYLAWLGAAAFIELAVRHLREIRPSVVEAHWLVPGAFPIASTVPQASTTAVAHGADVRLLLRLPDRLRSALVQRILRSTSSIRFVASTSRDQLLNALPSSLALACQARSWVSPIELELPDVRSKALQLREASHCHKIIVAAARMVPAKRLDLLVQAAQHSFPDETCWHLIGDGPERRRLQNLDTRKNITFHGRLGWFDTLAWLRAADLVVHPSALEAAPTVIREARALGTPVIACDAGDTKVWAASDSELMVVSPSVDALVEAITKKLQPS